MEFKERTVIMPNCDCDVTLKFPGGESIVIQARPSNADLNYNGSLDIILPKNQAVTNWSGDDMEAAPLGSLPHIRIAKQLCTDLPGDYS